MAQTQWNFNFLNLPLKIDWKISRNSSSSKTNLFIEYTDKNQQTFTGEAAPNIRYQETPESLQKEVAQLKSYLKAEARDIENVYLHVHKNQFSNCFRFAISCLYHRVLASGKGVNLFDYFGMAGANSCRTSYSLPILPAAEILPYLQKFNLFNFQTLKLKIKNQEHIKQLRELQKHYAGQVIVDANEGFSDWNQWQEFLKQISNLKNIKLIEQPFPSDQIELYQRCRPSSPFPIFLDESITNQPLPPDTPSLCHGVNIKLMKSGDPLIAIKQLQQAKSMGLQCMLGCMIESSLSIEMGLYLSSLCEVIDLDGFVFLKNDPAQRIKLVGDQLVPTFSL